MIEDNINILYEVPSGDGKLQPQRIYVHGDDDLCNLLRELGQRSEAYRGFRDIEEPVRGGLVTDKVSTN